MTKGQRVVLEGETGSPSGSRRGSSAQRRKQREHAARLATQNRKTEDAEEAEWMANARKRLGVAEKPGSEQKRPRKTGW